MTVEDNIKKEMMNYQMRTSMSTYDLRDVEPDFLGDP